MILDLEKFFSVIRADLGSRTYLETHLAIFNAESWSARLEKSARELFSIQPELLGDAHPFFISESLIAPDSSMSTEKNFMIDQPFRTVWVERTDGGALAWFREGETRSWVLGIFCHEILGVYLISTLLVTPDKNLRPMFRTMTGALREQNVLGQSFENNNLDIELEKRIHDVMHGIFKRFRKECAFTNEKIKPIRARVGSGKGRIAVKINKIVRVMLKSERTAYEHAIGHPVDWSHKWEVMGHWRKVQGLGKDRDDNYTIRGQTWVMPHVKGKGSLVKKQRVVCEPKPEATQ